MGKYQEATMKQVSKEELSASEETVVTLPAHMFDASELSALSELAGTSIVSRGDGALMVPPSGRDVPFPCFKKGRWEDEGVVDIVQKK